MMCVASSWAQGPNNSGTYYSSADGKRGAELKTALCGIIYNRDEGGSLSAAYKALWTHFQTTDARPNGTVWDMYSNKREMTLVEIRIQAVETKKDSITIVSIPSPIVGSAVR